MINLLNRELSWLKFNERVLDEAKKDIPLQDKFLFYGITGSNLDEFLMTRYPASLREDYFDASGISDIRPAIHRHYNNLQNRVASFLKEEKTLATECKSSKSELKKRFQKEIYPALQPVTFEQHSKINITSGITVFVETSIDDRRYYNYVEIPDKLGRWVYTEDKIIPIEELVIDNLTYIFKGSKIENAFAFRILRSAEVYIKSDSYYNPYKYAERTLKERMRSWITVVEIGCSSEEKKKCSKIIRSILRTTSDTIFLHTNIIRISDMKSLKSLKSTEMRTDECTPVSSFPENDVFDFIKEEDRLVFHPYESYADSFVRFIEEAAEDNKVISIKISLYRVSEKSRIINALLRAVDLGKQVTVLIELKARFDESHNMKLSKILQEAGVKLVYGNMNLKTHAKVCLVTRQEKKGVRIYTHIGTGNYSESNAKQYTDYSYFTADSDIGYDANRFFNLLTSKQSEFKSRKILYAPKNLRAEISSMIDEQIKLAEKKEPAEIVFKCNSLTDDKISKMLSKAASAGVKVILIVRGACVMEPAENIEIYSLIGMYLEHSRVYKFGPDKNCKIFIGSNDIMHRNLNARNELMVCIDNKKLKNRLLKHLAMYLKDTVGLRRILPAYGYEDIKPDEKDKPYNCQLKFFKEAEEFTKRR